MRKTPLLVVFLLLILCSCAKENAYTDINLEYVCSSAGAYAEAELSLISHSTQNKLGYVVQKQEITDANLLQAINDEICSRLGYRVESPLNEEPFEVLATTQKLATLVLDDPAVECYSLLFTRPNDPNNAEFFTRYEIHFVLHGNDTPEAAYLRVGNNFCWYTFDDPQGFINAFWSLEHLE